MSESIIGVESVQHKMQYLVASSLSLVSLVRAAPCPDVIGIIEYQPYKARSGNVWSCTSWSSFTMWKSVTAVMQWGCPTGRCR